FDKGGKAYEVNGQYVSGIQVDVVPRLQAADAVRIAQQDLVASGKPAGTSSKAPVLVIFARDTEPQLAYELMLSYDDLTGLPGRWRYWIEARQGPVLVKYNDVQKVNPPTTNGHPATITGSILSGEGGATVNVTGWYENANHYYYLYNSNDNWFVYNYAYDNSWLDANTYAFRYGPDWDDPAEMSAARNVDLVQQYYLQVQGRHSYDNSNSIMPVVSIHGYSYGNAFWDGQAIWFGDGGIGYKDSIADSYAVLDIVGHEFTHAVTEFTAGLIYDFDRESSALNESFSDIMGTSIEFWAEP